MGCFVAYKLKHPLIYVKTSITSWFVDDFLCESLLHPWCRRSEPIFKPHYTETSFAFSPRVRNSQLSSDGRQIAEVQVWRAWRSVCSVVGCCCHGSWVLACHWVPPRSCRFAVRAAINILDGAPVSDTTCVFEINELAHINTMDQWNEIPLREASSVSHITQSEHPM